PTARPIRAVLGVRGEPAQPDVPAKGHVWRAIVDQIGEPGSGGGDWVTIADFPRDRFAAHPWSLSGGGAGELLQRLENAKAISLGSRSHSIGIMSVTGEDDLYLLPLNGAAARLR